MTNLEINQLGSQIRQLHIAIVEKKGVNTAELETQFTASLLELINVALDGNVVMEQIIRLAIMEE